MLHRRQQVLICAFRPIGRWPVDEIAPHTVDMRFSLYAIAFAEQAREAGMRDGNVQAIGIIIADIFPVHLARPHGDAAKCLEFFKTVGRDLVFIRRHHFGHRRPAAFETNENEPAPDFHVDMDKASLVFVERWVRCAVWHTRQAAIKVIGPCMIGADQFFGAPVGAIDQSAAPMTADIGECAQDVVIAAHNNDTLADIIEGVPVACFCDIADMADHLP